VLGLFSRVGLFSFAHQIPYSLPDGRYPARHRGARRAAFATNSKLLAEVYFNHRCPDYGRIEKLIKGKYKTVAEKAYGIRHADN
jgi:hypothetical protein